MIRAVKLLLFLFLHAVVDAALRPAPPPPCLLSSFLCITS
jgi:hypothetical protein